MSQGETKRNLFVRMIRSRIIRAIAVIILIAAAGLVVFSEPLIKIFLKTVIQYRLAALTYDFEDGLHAGICGSGSPMVDINRTGPCVAVVTGKHLYIVDIGDGSTRNITLMGFQTGKIDAVLLTHFHSDHIAGLGELMLQRWAGGSHTTPIDVIGPTGVEVVVDGFHTAYSLDTGYRTAHHGPRTMPPSGAGGIAKPFTLGPAEDASVVVSDRDGVKITAFKVDHRPVVPAVGYRFDYKGRSLVISGDTVYSKSLLKHAKGVDLLIHDALSPWMIEIMRDQAHLSPVRSLKKIAADIPSYHASPEDAAKIAGEADVKHLVYNHIIPPIPNPMLNSLFLGDAKKYYKGPITMGVDGMLFSLPSGSREILVKKLL
ncbi:MAG: MBL fold metallo-hydrolase [Desulfobacteraceae bacterium]|nr:MAG: MBL fold metallo-hydrolase [Desulfobacteraceae bacterium]